MASIKKFFHTIWIWILAVIGKKTVYSHNIPNLIQVKPGVWRSGQPQSIDDWRYLKGLGINVVVKLNFESEGSDSGATSVGLWVYVLSIQPDGDKDIINDFTNTFLKPDPEKVAQADFIILKRDGVLVHCTHGHDRTGYLIGRHRVLSGDMPKDDAYDEMLELGFHPELMGLSEAWAAFEVSSNVKK